MSEESETFDVTAPLIATEFKVVCPSCETDHELMFVDDDFAEYAPRPEDKFIKCDCGALIEILPVEWRAKEKTPWVVIDAGAMRCQRCGESECLSMVTGKRLSFAAAIMKAFADCHKDCKA